MVNFNGNQGFCRSSPSGGINSWNRQNAKSATLIFQFLRGIVERSWWNFAVVLLVGLLYGGQIFGVLPTDEPISWQGHLFGLIGGLVAAILFRRRPQRDAYSSESTLSLP